MPLAAMIDNYARVLVGDLGVGPGYLIAVIALDHDCQPVAAESAALEQRSDVALAPMQANDAIAPLRHRTVGDGHEKGSSVAILDRAARS